MRKESVADEVARVIEEKEKREKAKEEKGEN